jgi:hypothetical protein
LSGAWQGTSPDVGVRRLRAHHDGLRHVGKRDVVGIAALAGNEGLVFETPNGLANAEFHGNSVKKSAVPLSLRFAPCGKMGFGTLC